MDTTTRIAVLGELTESEIRQRLIELTDEAELLRHLLRGLQSRDKIRHVRANGTLPRVSHA